MPVEITPEADPQGLHWDGRHWSTWEKLDAAIAPYEATAPHQPGVYRLRVHDTPGLIYIGQTGDSLRNRLRQLRKATEYVSAGKDPGPPHVGGGCVLSFERKGLTVEVSWVSMPGVDRRERLGIECELIAAYRKATGENPSCQFAGSGD